ncbi:MAG: hypothetical protein CYPHOPRED_003646 [Cyphobasidiales sp. Tagirdzhanova-0007]|nr:MAG: hypothetical protein CYPHOPRED_003646 [Cyphobasidiales sp. Tagirdzhanova-0007]
MSTPQVRSIRAEIPNDILAVNADDPEELSSFHLSQGVTFEASIIRGKREEPASFDAFAVDMRSAVLNTLLVIQAADNTQKLIINDGSDKQFGEMSDALKHELADV